jgi:hypothetical protein
MTKALGANPGTYLATADATRGEQKVKQLTAQVTQLQADCLNDGQHRQGNLFRLLKISLVTG